MRPVGGAMNCERRNSWKRLEKEMERLMTTQEVAQILSVSKTTVCRWRLNGNGPKEIGEALVWLGDIPRYRADGLIAFVKGDAA